MANNLTHTFLYGSRIVQATSVRTLTSQQGKGPVDNVKQAEKVKEVVSNAISPVVGAVKRLRYHLLLIFNQRMRHAVSKTTNHSGYETSCSSSINPSSSYNGSHPASQSSSTHEIRAPYTSDSPTESSGEYNRSCPSTADKIRDQVSDCTKQAKSTTNQTGNKAR
ncbi:unnamed protein product [Rotaria sp. Silwood2]|nr:unnamed protein product [Rotaria sp. Silwood2]